MSEQHPEGGTSPPPPGWRPGPPAGEFRPGAGPSSGGRPPVGPTPGWTQPLGAPTQAQGSAWQQPSGVPPPPWESRPPQAFWYDSQKAQLPGAQLTGPPPWVPAAAGPAGQGSDEGRVRWWPLLLPLSLVLGLLGGLFGAVLIGSPDPAPSPVAPAVPVITASGPVAGGSKASPVIDVADKVLPSVVSIQVKSRAAEVTGSGFVYDGVGHIVTNNHVVEPAVDGGGEIVVLLSDGSRQPATIVGRSPSYDLAVIQLEDRSALVPATLGRSANTQQSGSIGVGFSIPIDQVRRTVDQIIDIGHAEYPVVGAQVRITPALDGARVQEVTDASPAAQAGLEKGDIITAVNGTPVADGVELIVTIRSFAPGDVVTLSVESDGRADDVEVKLGTKVG